MKKPILMVSSAYCWINEAWCCDACLIYHPKTFHRGYFHMIFDDVLQHFTYWNVNSLTPTFSGNERVRSHCSRSSDIKGHFCIKTEVFQAFYGLVWFDPTQWRCVLLWYLILFRSRSFFIATKRPYIVVQIFIHGFHTLYYNKRIIVDCSWPLSQD